MQNVKSITKRANKGDSECVKNTSTTKETSSNTLVGTTQSLALKNECVLERSRPVELDTQGMVTT